MKLDEKTSEVGADAKLIVVGTVLLKSIEDRYHAFWVSIESDNLVLTPKQAKMGAGGLCLVTHPLNSFSV